MSHVPHELHEEFPEDAATLRELKLSDSHFQKLADGYHEVNRAIHRAETDVEPTSGVRLEEMKKQRLALLDDISAIVAGARV
jgi:uncharacterized protein YdcH (DUF465 family)